MQLGSLGATGLPAARQLLYRSNPARNIFTRPTRLSPGKHFLTQSRHFLSSFITHLTTPGLGHQATTSFSTAARATVQQRCSLPVQRALARPTAFLPRSPAIPRSVHQVGLGSVRQFSSARPVFQNLVQNVPVAARAFCEADLDVKAQSRTSAKALKVKQSKNGRRAPTFKVQEFASIPAVFAPAVNEGDMDVYFPAPAASVTTCLHIPLAPTPSQRTPLREASIRTGSFVPVSLVATIHMDHETHGLRVSSLFSRLDAADVWSKGVTSSAYSHLSRGEGVCTILKVEFVGWTKDQVRAVIGESGTGWCALEEVRREPESFLPIHDGDCDSDCSETSSVLSGLTSECDSRLSSGQISPAVIDPSASFVLPTLDFSSSFMDIVAHTPSSLSRSSSDASIDFASISGSSEASGIHVGPTIGLSADFMGRRTSVGA